MRQWKSTLRKALSKALHNARGRSRLSAEVSRLYRCQTKIRYVSELTQQDGRAKKTANLVWQEWQYKFCLNKENLPQISPSFKNDQNTLLVKITTKHASNSPVTCVTHKRFAVLLFLPSVGEKREREGRGEKHERELERGRALSLTPQPPPPFSLPSSPPLAT